MVMNFYFSRKPAQNRHSIATTIGVDMIPTMTDDSTLPRINKNQRTSMSSSSSMSSLSRSLQPKKSSASISPTLTASSNSSAVTLFDYKKHTGTSSLDKLNYRLHEINRKIQTEQKVIEGAARLLDATRDDAIATANVRPTLADKMRESWAKISVLETAKLCHGELGEQMSDVVVQPSDVIHYKKSKGHLQIKVIGVFNLEGTLDSKICTISLDGSRKFTSHHIQPWDEVYESQVIAKEVEICVYSYPEGSLMGLVWFQLEDLEHELWTRYPRGQPASVDDMEDIWVDMEPFGHVLLKASFVPEKTTHKRSHSEQTLFDEDTHATTTTTSTTTVPEYSKNGHIFDVRTFSSKHQCAVCDKTSIAGAEFYKCKECRFACHVQCLSHVLSQCSGDDAAIEDQHIILKDHSSSFHKIPHIFKSKTRFGGGKRWCSHCGYKLKLGARILECTECKKCCHTNCKPMMPHFCQLDQKAVMEWKRAFDNLERKRQSVAFSTMAVALEREERIASAAAAAADRCLDSTTQESIYSSGRCRSAPVSRRNIQTIENRHHHVKSKGPSLDDYFLVSVLGKGRFGKVVLVEDKSTKKLYAMKAQKKEAIVKDKNIDGVQLELQILQMATRSQHPFLVSLQCSFQTDSQVYFVMEYVSGGDLINVFEVMNGRFTQQQAVFYACEVLLALEYLHGNDIVYRDLKLDNILMCADGHIKLADYGICKGNMGFNQTTKTYCGTAEYMAPEIIQGGRYTRAVDWWGFGVLFFAMLTGKFPFGGASELEVLKEILSRGKPKAYPNTSGLIEKLLVADPMRRLGSGPNDAYDIKAHPYFTGLDWNKFLDKSITPPWKPTIRSAKDVSNFDKQFTNEQVILTPIPARNQLFEGFDFC